MAKTEPKFIIQKDADLLLFYKKDKEAGAWVTKTKCSKFTKREDAKKWSDVLVTYYKTPCTIVKEN